MSDDDGIDPIGCAFGLLLTGMTFLFVIKILWEVAKALFAK